MNITLNTNDSLDGFVGRNEKGHQLNLSGDGTGVGPMESVLMAIASCSTIDIIMILKKMKQDLKGIEVQVKSKRREEPPRTFTEVMLHYNIKGQVKEKKAEQAINSSLEKYCSVSKMIEKSAVIKSSFSISD